MSAGLYIHVPFCRSRCHFCAFYLQIHRDDRVQSYLETLRGEIQLHHERGTLGSREVSSIYFGGGTPTTLRTEELCEVLALIRKTFRVAQNAEITIEAAPDTVTAESLTRLREAGWNRLSIGVQSMDEVDLLTVGRRMIPERSMHAVRLARQAGFDNINLDLIYGLPGQTLESWRHTVEEALRLEPMHLACYALTVEQKTRLTVDIHRGDRSAPDPELQNAMEETAAGLLKAAGYEHYEISNYSRPGYACRHNLLYWQDGDYLGLGPSAQSYLESVRFGNVEDLQAYRDTIMTGRLPIAERHELTTAERRREAVVFGLRLTAGLALDPQHDMDDAHRAKIERLLEEGLLERTPDCVRLTPMGRRFADSVALELF